MLLPFAFERELPADPLLVSAFAPAFVERPDSDLGSLSTLVRGTGVGAGERKATCFFCALSEAVLDSAVLRWARGGLTEAPSIESWRGISVRVTVKPSAPTRSSCEGAREFVLPSGGDGRGVREEDARDSSDCTGELGRDVGGDESGDMATGAGETERSRAGSSSCGISRPTGEGSGSIVGEGGIDDRRESGEDI